MSTAAYASTEKIKHLLDRATLQKLLDELPPAQRLRGLAPEQRLAGLSEEQRLLALLTVPAKHVEGATPRGRVRAPLANGLSDLGEHFARAHLKGQAFLGRDAFALCASGR
jgi:hypothetical protein